MSENRMRLRSSVSEEDRNLEKMKLETEKQNELNRPYIEYKGAIHYYTEFVDCAEKCDHLLTLAEKTNDLLVLGFDLEWPFSFQSGSGSTSVIQISPNLEICYIFHISRLKKLPRSLNLLLAHSKVRITGVNIKNDIHKLSRDFPGLDTESILNNCVDTGVFCNKLLPEYKKRWSMEKLVGHLLKMKINKDNKVRMSKWHVIPLSTEQQIYAAIDAYASLLLYNHLKELEKSVCDVQTEI